MNDNNYILGIDTSNYKTSVAVTDRKGNIVCDYRELLKVKQGEKGLRQSDALFQHIKNLPRLLEETMNIHQHDFDAVAYSSKPRPMENSYMPVFLAGEGYGKAIAAALRVPAFEFSHQEGHIEAIKAYSRHRDKERVLACHFSGGTCEVLRVKDNDRGYDIDIVGGSMDISFGQVLDRLGVQLGMPFPAGEEMDRIAVNADSESQCLTPVKVNDGWINLSGIDTQARRTLADMYISDATPVIRELFHKMSDAIVAMIKQCTEKTGISDVIMAGGVTASSFIKETISRAPESTGIDVEFGDGKLAQDNAVGIALLGGRFLWR